MDFRLNLMMMLPESFRKRMIGDRSIEKDGRTMSPAMQIILYILEEKNHRGYREYRSKKNS